MSDFDEVQHFWNGCETWYLDGYRQKRSAAHHQHNLCNLVFELANRNGPLTAKMPNFVNSNAGVPIDTKRLTIEALAQAGLNLHNIGIDSDVHLFCQRDGRDYVMPACFGTEINDAELRITARGARKLHDFGLEDKALKVFVASQESKPQPSWARRSCRPTHVLHSAHRS